MRYLSSEANSGEGGVGLGQIHERPHRVPIDRHTLHTHTLEDSEAVPRTGLAITRRIGLVSSSYWY